MNKKKLILIILIVLIVLAGLAWIFFYVTRPVSIAIKFKPDITEEQAVAVVEKYNTGIRQQKYTEYSNPFFSFLYPFSQTHRIEFEIGWINAELTARRIGQDDAAEVEKVYVLGSYEEQRAHGGFYESLNLALKNP